MNQPDRLALSNVDINSDNPLMPLLAAQQQAFLAQGAPSYQRRLDNLARLREAIVDHKERIVESVESDFGHRSRHETLLADVVGLLGEIRHNRKNLRRWMKPQKAHFSPQFMFAKAQVIYQPKGVVGVIGAWNVPVLLTLSPLIGALSAGNRAMVKTSEFCPKTAEVIKSIVEQAFDADEVLVINGDAEVAGQFTALPFDHIIFTGSTQIGKKVMRAASEHLTPVTLELGGKSPTIIAEDFPLDLAAERITQGKMLNAGQACIAPDYLFVKEEQQQAMIDALRQAIEAAYPNYAENPDLTWVVNDRHYGRLKAHVDDARAKGATVVEINPGNKPIPDGSRIFPLTVLLNVNDDMTVMQEEIFGPILPLKTYQAIDEAIDYVNQHPHPLALYHFDYNGNRTEKVLRNTLSGGACVNDVLFHVMHEGLAFGGVGTSGIGSYNGDEGFKTFSHAKSVLKQSRISLQSLVRPPFGKGMERFIDFAVRWM